VPVALRELVRDDQIACDRAEAEQVLTYLLEHVLQRRRAAPRAHPGELIDADGRPVAL
jgi:hypothetical protein